MADGASILRSALGRVFNATRKGRYRACKSCASYAASTSDCIIRTMTFPAVPSVVPDGISALATMQTLKITGGNNLPGESHLHRKL